MFLSEWREFPSAPCLSGKETWWQLASRCCWNRALPWHASEIFPPFSGLAKDLSASRYEQFISLFRKKNNSLVRDCFRIFFKLYKNKLSETRPKNKQAKIRTNGMPVLKQNDVSLSRIVQRSLTSLERSHICDLYAAVHKCNYENA